MKSAESKTSDGSSTTLVAWLLTAAHLSLALAFSSSALREEAKQWDWVWTPYGDWNAAVVAIPFLIAATATWRALRAQAWWCVGLNVLASIAWGVLLLFRFMSETVA